MSKKISLVYENNKYGLYINENLIKEGKDLEELFEKFKQNIKDNTVVGLSSWESIEEKLREFNMENIEINNDHKAASYGNMKFFHGTGKVFYLKDGQMIQLIGGIYFFYSVLELIKSSLVEDLDGLLDFCKKILEKRASYRINEGIMTISCAAFNYGSAEYNFTTKKIYKGASVEKGSFNYYKEYVLNILSGIN